MRARWDNSKLEHVRTKVQRLKKSLLLAERKLREAREILTVVAPDLKRAFGRRSEVNRYVLADGLVFKPLRTASLGRYGLESYWKFKDFSNTKLRNVDEDSTICKRISNDCSSQDGIISSPSLRDIANGSTSRGGTLVRSPMHRLTLKVRTTREKTAVLKNHRETIHEKLRSLDDKMIKVHTRTQYTEEVLKTLHERMAAIQSRFVILQNTIQTHKQAEIRICKLEKRIDFETKRANVGEIREGELETRVLELEDSLEEYDMKIHRAQKVLCRMDSFEGDDSPGKESCSVTMVLKRVSLSRQSSSASLKGRIPSLILDSCGEESDISDDETFE